MKDRESRVRSIHMWRSSAGLSFAFIWGLTFLPGDLQALDYWELPPVSYSDTAPSDPIARFSTDLRSGIRAIEGNTELEKLAFVLKELGISQESQILVFSKTSHQNSLITPETPRALYFNENSYVGYVPGGFIEIATHDVLLGTVFYVLDLHKKDPALSIQRDTSSCLACHATTRTEGIPGVLVRSVHPDSRGNLLLRLGSESVDDSTPIPLRWGGYYITGSSALPHLGNRIFDSSSQRGTPTSTIELLTLDGKIDTQKYLRPTSDIVAITVLEHQCRIYNLLVKANLEYRRHAWTEAQVARDSTPHVSRLPAIAESAAERIVEGMLFQREAPLGEGGIVGNTSYQDTFQARFPKTSSGHSLADFSLESRIFKNRCSYMIYSGAFKALPDEVRKRVLSKIQATLEDTKSVPHMGQRERTRISAILKETLPGYPHS